MAITEKLILDSRFAVSGRPILYSPRDFTYHCGPFEMGDCFLLRQRRNFDWHLHIAQSFRSCLQGTVERFMKKV